MKIKELYIYGFGRFENERITFGDRSLHVFYGKNESGKSTILAYIEYMLFGFPKRNEKRLRYEPKTTQAYGGKMSIETDQHGSITIERKGDRSVEITRADGSIEDDSFLKEILSEVNQLTYRDIFSFNLDGLQRIDQIKAEELGNYLFNAAMTGAHELNRISAYLEEQQGNLFKPNGKNPILNRQLAQLMEQDRELRNWTAKLDDYERVKSELSQKKKELEANESERKQLEGQRKEFGRIQSVAPLIEQKVLVENQLEQLTSALPFPESGLERFGSWKERKVEAEGERDHIRELIDRKQAELDTIEVDDRLFDHAEEIDRLEKEYESYKVRATDYEKMKQRIGHLEDELDREKGEIGEGWTTDAIKKIRTDVVAKQQIKQLIKENDDLQFQRKSLDRELQQARESIEERESQLAEIEGQLISEEQIRSDEEKLRTLTDGSPSMMRQQVETLKRLRSSSPSSPMNPMLVGLMVIVGLALMGIGLYRGDIVEGLIIGIALIGSGAILFRKNKNHVTGQLDEQISELESKISALNNESTIETDLTALQHRIEKQRQLRYQKERFQEESEQLELRYQKVASDYDEWEIRYHQNKGMLDKWRQQFSIPESVSNEMVVEMVERIEHLKRRIHELERIGEEADQLQEGLALFESEATRLASFGNIAEAETGSIVDKLVFLLKTEREKREHRKTVHSEMNRYKEQLAAVRKKTIQYEQECEALLKKAEVENEEQYWVKGKEFANYQSLLEKRRMTDSQLQVVATVEEVARYAEHLDEFPEIDAKIKETDKRLRELIESIESTRDDCAQLQARLTQLEEDGTYSDLLHKIEVAKSEFYEQAKKWAVLRTAEYVLQRAKQNYQAKKQPGVLKRAEEYFQRLTDGEYVKLLAPKGEESFLIERNDTILFRPEELSRATAEQLYLALRFALAKEYETNKSFPFIIDDVLVNFDDKRREKAVELIEAIAAERQIIYFTCDERTASALSTEPILLERNPAPVLP